MTHEVAIIDAVRTPIGRYNGALKDVRPDDLAADTIRALLARNPKIDPNTIEEVYLGCANQAGEDNRNIARIAALLADLPVSVAGVTFNRLCASGLEAVNAAARAIMLGDGDTYIAGGVESMTRAPYVLSKAEAAFDRNLSMYDTTLGWRFPNPRLFDAYYPYSLGETAENVADKWGITREEQDLYALNSQRRTAQAISQGRFDSQIVPVVIPGRRRQPATTFEVDEHPRPDVTLERLRQLKPVFKEGGTVTPGNASGINDGAAALILMSRARAERLGLKPLAYVRAMAAAGVDPGYMGIGPVPAVKKVLKRANLSLDQIDLIELNEAFASQVIASMRELGMDDERVNVNGGAIALGHPLGCSGARLVTALAHELNRREARYGMATLCVGIGQGLATIIERV